MVPKRLFKAVMPQGGMQLAPGVIAIDLALHLPKHKPFSAAWLYTWLVSLLFFLQDPFLEAMAVSYKRLAGPRLMLARSFLRLLLQGQQDSGTL